MTPNRTVTDLPQSQLDGLAPTLMKEVLPTFRLEFGVFVCLPKTLWIEN